MIQQFDFVSGTGRARMENMGGKNLKNRLAAFDRLLLAANRQGPLPHGGRSAEDRGVQVRILTNSISSNNHLTAHSAYRKHVKRLVKMGVDVHEVRAYAKDRDVYIESPVEDKSLCLHAKVLIFDSGRVFIGSANLDPRSMRINTEKGLLIESPALHEQLTNQRAIQRLGEPRVSNCDRHSLRL